MATNAHSFPTDSMPAGQLAQSCAVGLSSPLTTCMAFTRGVLDALRSVDGFVPAPAKLCVPPVTGEDRRRALRRWVKAQGKDESWKARPAAELVAQALRAAYLCTK